MSRLIPTPKSTEEYKERWRIKIEISGTTIKVKTEANKVVRIVRLT